MDLKIDKQMFNNSYLPYIYDYDKRYNVYYGGRSSGKSYFICDKLILKCLNEKSRQMWIMKELSRCRKSLFTMLKDALDKFQINNSDFVKISESDGVVTFLHNKSTIYILGADEPTKLRGYVDIDTVWIDECNDVSVEVVDYLDGTIRGKSKHKQMYFSFNPVSKSNWVYTYFHFDDTEKQVFDEDLFVLKSTYRDNKWCDEADIKRFARLKERDYARWLVESEGDFATLEDLVFPKIKVESFDFTKLLKECKPIFGLDFGFEYDYTTIISSLVDDTNMVLYIYDEMFGKHMKTSDIAQAIFDRHIQKRHLVCDRQEARLISELRDLGINAHKCSKGHGSIMTGINKIKEYEIVVHPNCTHLIEEFQNYCYKKDKDGNYLSVPIDSWNHGIDALRYSLNDYSNTGKTKFLKCRM